MILIDFILKHFEYLQYFSKSRWYIEQKQVQLKKTFRKVRVYQFGLRQINRVNHKIIDCSINEVYDTYKRILEKGI